MYFDDSSSRPSAGFCARVGAFKTVLRSKRHSHDGAESHSFFFFFAPTCTSFILTTPLPQDYRLRKLSLRTVLPLSLSLRGWLQTMPVLNICSFWIHWLGSAASRDPLLFEGVLVWLRSSLTTATSLVPCRKGSYSPIQEPRVLLLPWLRLQKKADSDTHITDHYSVEQTAALW